MVRSRGSMMAGMRPSNRIPMRTSKDGPFWHTNENRNCDTTQHKMSILRDWNTAQLSKINSPRRLQILSMPTQTGATDLTQSGRWWSVSLWQQDGPWGQGTCTERYPKHTSRRYEQLLCADKMEELWFNNAHIEKHMKILQPITNLQM